jgi:ClpX C4-type zinc finger
VNPSSPEHCSFCGRALPASAAPTADLHRIGTAHVTICGQCLELAGEFLDEPAPVEPGPNLPCSFCGSGNGTPRRTVPGPNGVAICGPCVQERRGALPT